MIEGNTTRSGNNSAIMGGDKGAVPLDEDADQVSDVAIVTNEEPHVALTQTSTSKSGTSHKNVRQSGIVSLLYDTCRPVSS